MGDLDDFTPRLSKNGEHRDEWHYDVMERRGRWRRFHGLSLYYSAGLIMVIGLAIWLWPSFSASLFTKADKTMTAADPFTSIATSSGATTCVRTYAELGSALIAGSRFAFQTQVADKDANGHMIQGIIGMNLAENDSLTKPAAGIVLAAPNGTSCEGHSVRVVPVRQDCKTVAGLLPKDSKALPPLSGLAFYSIPTGEQTLLLPVGEDCVAVTTLLSKE